MHRRMRVHVSFSRSISSRFLPRRPLFLLIGLALGSGFFQSARADDAFSVDAENARIQQYRTADVSLTVTDANGAPRANVPVTVSMTRSTTTPPSLSTGTRTSRRRGRSRRIG
jgi:hypothetical protein